MLLFRSVGLEFLYVCFAGKHHATPQAPEDRRPFYKNTRWWIGMIFVIISALMQFASFALAPQSIITPLGAFTLVVNLVMANRFLGEPLGKIDIIGKPTRSIPLGRLLLSTGGLTSIFIAGTILICAGMAVAVVASGVKDVSRTIEDINDLWIRFETLGYLAAVAVVVGFYMLTRYRAERILQNHIEKVGQLLIVEAHRLGVYGDSEDAAAEKLHDAERPPADSALLTQHSNADAVLAARSPNSHSPEAWGAEDRTPPQEIEGEAATFDGNIKHSVTAPAPNATGTPLSPPPRTRAQGKSVPNASEGGPTPPKPTALAAGLQRAAANVKHETTRDAAPSYKAPDLTVFLKGTDTATQAALNAVGKRQKTKRVSASSADAASAGATPAAAAAGDSPAMDASGSSSPGSAPASGPLPSDTPSGDDTGALATASGDAEGVEQIEFVDLEAVSELIGAPPVGYDSYATLHPLAYAGLAGVIGAQNTLFAKAVGEALTATIEGDNQFDNGFTYLYLGGLVTSIVFQQHFLAAGLQLFDALYIVPVFQAHFIVFGVLSGGLFYDEFSQYDTLASILFPIGIVIGLSGVLLLTNRKRGADAEHKPLPSDEEEAAKLAEGPVDTQGAFDGVHPTFGGGAPLRRGSTLPVGVESYTAAVAGGGDVDSGEDTSANALPRSNSAEAGTGVGFLDSDTHGAEAAPSGGDVHRRHRLASEGALDLGTAGRQPLGSHQDVAAARAAAAQSFADFIASKAATPTARGGGGGAGDPRRGSTFLRNNWVESLLDRRADQQRVYSFMQGGSTSSGPGEVDTRRSPGLAGQEAAVRGTGGTFALPPSAGIAGTGRRRAFSVALAARGAPVTAGGAAVVAGAAPLQRGATAPLEEGVAPVPTMQRSATGGGSSPVARGRTRAATHSNIVGGGFSRRRSSVLEQAIDGIGTISSAALAGLRSVGGGGGGEEPAAKSGANTDSDDDEELNDQYARAFGFDSVMEMRPHLAEERPVSAPTMSPPQTGLTGIQEEGDVETGAGGAAVRETHSLQVSPAMKGREGRRMTLGDRLARGVAGVSQFFLAEQATAALTSGTYAGRQGAVTFLDATPALPLNEDEVRAPSSAPGRARVLSEDAGKAEPQSQPPMARLTTSVDVPEAIEEHDGSSEETPSATTPTPTPSEAADNDA